MPLFPNGYHLVESGKKPEDEYFYFRLNNLLSLTNSDKILYFVCAIIYESLNYYKNIKYKNKVPKLKENFINLNKIYAPKALCFSSFCPFPTELKSVLIELIRYTRSNEISVPLEIIMENIVNGIPRPLRIYYYVLLAKSSGIIPSQTKDIEFNPTDINLYNIISFPLQPIFTIFTSNQIMLILYSILTEIPILFFGKNKEKLTSIIEGFLCLIYPFEYQCPVIPILPDCMSGLIELEKSFIFGINQSFDLVQDKVRKLKYFSDMHLNIYKRTFMVIDIDKPYVNSFCTQLDDYHLVNFKDLGIYENNINDDKSIKVSKDAFTGNANDILQEIQFPSKYIIKIKNKIDSFQKENKVKNWEFLKLTNKLLGCDIVNYFLASIFLDYNNYLYNSKEEVDKICNNLMSKKYDEININDLFNVNKFLQDHKDNLDFYPKFFGTKIFKNFIIRKYLNDP